MIEFSIFILNFSFVFESDEKKELNSKIYTAQHQWNQNSILFYFFNLFLLLEISFVFFVQDEGFKLDILFSKDTVIIKKFRILMTIFFSL